MESPSRYWKMCIIDSLNPEKSKPRTIKQAEDFFRFQFPDLAGKITLLSKDNKNIQAILWNIFYFHSDSQQRALAGLCLRCYVSRTILISCKKISNSYSSGGEKLFTYHDLLPLVLHDDGKLLIILDRDNKTQLVLKKDSTNQPLDKAGEIFSVEILRKFNPTLNNSLSLNNWTWRLTQQNKSIILFLWNLGLRTPSDWGLLCNTQMTRSLLPRLEIGDKEIIKVFHAVYRRDRINFGKTGRCKKPNQKQLQEMLYLLQQINIIIGDEELLLRRLKDIAEILRQDMLSRKTGSPKTIPTEILDDTTNNYQEHPDLPYYTDPDLETIEIEELIDDCGNLFKQVLQSAIAEVISQRIEELRRSKGYKQFAQRFLEGLQILYQENKSLGDISNLWGIPRITVTRIFQLENLLEKVQYCTEKKFLDKISQGQAKYKLKIISCNQDDIKNITEAIRNFVNEKTFDKARTEIGSKKQVKNSLFAQLIRVYINNHNQAA